MPRSTREWSFRKLDEAAGNLDTALFHIEEVRQKYAEPHPEVAQPMEEVQKLLIFGLELISKIRSSY